MNLFYRPQDGALADVIPFYWNGQYHLFYLKDYRGLEGQAEGTPWFHLVTRDFVHFEDWGEAIPIGLADAQDRWIFTGSVIEKDGEFSAFYTAHNRHLHEKGGRVEGITRAVSSDLRTWRKEPELMFFAPDGYEKHDWRDPFVFWDDTAQEYRMLITARHDDVMTPTRRRGVTAQAGSRDLSTWEMRPDFWAPHEYQTHECCDLFQAGDWWYLLYSEHTVTQYRMSRSPHGPWQCPPTPAFDGRAFYAAKTAGDETRRFLFGWLATRAGEKDEGLWGWEWGGDMVVHEIVQHPDGTLGVQLPATVAASFGNTQPLSPQSRLGTWETNENAFAAHSPSGYASLTLGELPQHCLVEATVVYEPGTASFGLLLNTDEQGDSGYEVRMEPGVGRLVIAPFPAWSDRTFWLERRFAMQPGHRLRLQVVRDGTALVIYAADEDADGADSRIALSCRTYDHRSGLLGLFATEGTARFQDVVVKS